MAFFSLFDGVLETAEEYLVVVAEEEEEEEVAVEVEVEEEGEEEEAGVIVFVVVGVGGADEIAVVGEIVWAAGVAGRGSV